VDFALSPEQREIVATFHAFAEKEIRPRAAALDESPEFPREIFRRAGELGFFGMRHPAPLGSGSDVSTYVLCVEELAWGSLAVAAACTMQSLMGTHFVERFAPPEVRERLLVPAMMGEKVGTICMTEPESGSDLFSMKTTARLDGGTYRLTGSKTWITSAPVADFFTVFARTGEKQLGAFLVEKGASGLVVGRSIDKMGVRASLTSEVFFEDTPATSVLGDPTLGTKYLQGILAEIRVMTGALSLGIGRAAYEDALAYAAERRQFGKSIDSFQAVQAHLADMATELEAARQLVRWAAWRSDQGLPNATQASMAKLFASEMAAKNCDRAARVLASWGFASESPVNRYLRDVRFLLIGGGTSEILRGNIARELRA
jgi:alkylation response protein AidB-like acyl-CoA dehydrogenase